VPKLRLLKRVSKSYLAHAVTFKLPEFRAQLEGLDVEEFEDSKKTSKIFTANADAKLEAIKRNHPDYEEDWRLKVQQVVTIHQTFDKGSPMSRAITAESPLSL